MVQRCLEACQFAPFLHIQAQGGLERVGEFYISYFFTSFNFFKYVLELSCKESYRNSYEYLKKHSNPTVVFKDAPSTVSCVFAVKSALSHVPDRSYVGECFQIFLCCYSEIVPK